MTVLRYVNIYRREDGSLKVGNFLHESEENAKTLFNEEVLESYVTTKEVKIELI